MQENSEVFRLHDVNRHNDAVDASAQNWDWRTQEEKRMLLKKEQEEVALRDAIHRRNLDQLNVLGTKQVAEYFRCSQATAWFYMKSGVIPSFQVGRTWLTTSTVIDTIEQKARDLFASGYAKRTMPRLVYKFDSGRKW